MSIKLKSNYTTLIAGGTGGHMYPAISIIDEIKKTSNVFFITDKRGYHYLINNKNLLSQSSFDILILDVMMPGQSGYELTAEIKKTIQVPVILLTAKGEVENRIKGLELGADDYIGKPVEPKELLLRIKKISKIPKKKD